MRRVVRIGDIAEQIRGVTYPKGDASADPRPGCIPILRAGNIRDTGLSFSDLVYVPSSRVTSRQLVRRNDVLIAASSGSLEVVGKAARSLADFDGGFGAFLKLLRPNREVDPGYFAHYFRTPGYRRTVSALAAGANINNLKKAHLDDLRIPLPLLGEQRRIAAILDQADALRVKRREEASHLGHLARSIFDNSFGEDLKSATASLGDLATVSSGLTKGRRTSQPTESVPYLAVANVQAGHLNLQAVKEIEATAAEIERYALADGDLLLTEGGDPDKLGRGTVWRNELPRCLHQNHIFRVRIQPESGLQPDYLSAYMASQPARSYFLRAAKQTTGIASINLTQLKAMPVYVPSGSRQEAYLERMTAVNRQRATVLNASAQLDALFASLQSRAFRGEL